MTVAPDLIGKLPDTICAAIKVGLPQLKMCKRIEGKFNLPELKKKGIAAPAVLVSILGAKEDEQYAGSGPTFLLSMAAYVTTKNGMAGPRDIAAAVICQNLLGLIPGQRWGEPAVGPARDVKMATLVSGKAQDNAVSLWAVTWNQPVTFFCKDPQPVPIELYVADDPNQGGPRTADDFSQMDGGQP